MDIDILLDKKNNIEASANALTPQEIEFLVSLLGEKNDEVRYAAFLLLKQRSMFYPDVYGYWDMLADKLDSENSYQRSIGIMLIAENVRWDENGKFENIFEKYISCFEDEKFITSRQAIQSVLRWMRFAPKLLNRAVRALISVNVQAFKETQRKLILTDIVNSLIAIRDIETSDEIDGYLYNAATGGLLDKKLAKQITNLLISK